MSHLKKIRFMPQHQLRSTFNRQQDIFADLDFIEKSLEAAARSAAEKKPSFFTQDSGPNTILELTDGSSLERLHLNRGAENAIQVASRPPQCP
jgi:hypothetical protein